MEKKTTARVEAEQALRDSERLLQTLIDTIDGEIFVKDKDGIYLYVNRAFGKVFNVDPAEVIGKDDYFVFSPQTAAMLQANDQRIMAEKEVVNIEESTVLNGEPITYLTNKAPLFDDDGSVIGICGVGIDITPQKALEKALQDAHDRQGQTVRERTAQLAETVVQLREAEHRYRTVADFAFNWEYWANLDGSLEYVSPSCERISGYSPGEFAERRSLTKDIILPEDQNIWQTHFEASRRQPGTYEIQFRIRCRDGSVCWIEHVCQPVHDDQGAMIGIRASNRDITLRKEREIELQKAYAQITELKNQLEADRSYLLEEIKLSHDHEHIIADSDLMKYVLFRTEQIAPTDTTVLILGETGTGKELIARTIHNHSTRKSRPLIKVDCAALPANLIESELFGHEKGAFTSAAEKRVGRFELADGATLFLDEIGELPLELQSKLLRVLQDGEFERVGSSRTRRTNVRIIAATNRNLEDDIRQNKFRMDLWYRLSVFTITMPPLRERGRDLLLLANHMTRQFARKHGKPIASIAAETIAKLKAHHWPGNIRELENVIERAVLYTRGAKLQLDDAVATLSHLAMDVAEAPLKSLAELEKEHILLALRKTQWQIHGKNGAAALLDINPSTLRGRMRKHAIHKPPIEG